MSLNVTHFHSRFREELTFPLLVCTMVEIMVPGSFFLTHLALGDRRQFMKFDFRVRPRLELIFSQGCVDN